MLVQYNLCIHVYIYIYIYSYRISCRRSWLRSGASPRGSPPCVRSGVAGHHRGKQRGHRRQNLQCQSRTSTQKVSSSSLMKTLSCSTAPSPGEAFVHPRVLQCRGKAPLASVRSSPSASAARSPAG